MNLIDEYHRAFPGVRLTIFQQEMIEDEVKDEKAWKQAVRFWAANDYRPRSIGKMIEYYKDVVNGRVQSFSDKSKVAMQAGKWDGTEPEVTLTPCSYCGKEICFDSHIDERRAA